MPLRRSSKRSEHTPGASHERQDGTIATTAASRAQVAWRRSAQNVRRAWSEWSAAEGRPRAGLFNRYVHALDQEKRAALELEQVVASARSSEAAARIEAPGMVGLE